MSAGKNQTNKDKEMAAYLKAKGITRRTGQCPSCHHPLPVGGTALLAHIPNCTGRPKHEPASP